MSVDNTALRTALWRALHLEVDAAPAVFEDRVGLEIAAPDEGWRQRPDMDPVATQGFRASMVARARFVEELVRDRNPDQYVILGAGLDSFAQREPGVVKVFEIDQPGTQAWKRERLRALGYPLPTLVPVDFEAGRSWPAELAAAGFDPTKPAVFASTGVSMYLEKATTAQTLRDIAALAPGTTLAMTFLLPPDLLDSADRPGLRAGQDGAKVAGTPFVSFYRPEEMLDAARAAGFTDVRHVPGSALAERYFANRTDGLRPSSGEDFLVATA
ncbi:class I SAM-dependent methyltransferase [Amycolatopsis rhabdoformis]|uniref:S-adenosyl-L-methionine-dependent methyltransferase n=1 Tax=Amycolatopsis rhabdoformis TaxID=1448059 RepID=A0ABZ1I4Q1_9PSEU|nr:class I SAM-dependent methyltransferase [Amycolatopsis rhabdoformis]WSE29383.1 class I SAM-dependent methyltransferase [Amycolatopsis rhabdoformis]